MPEKLKKPEAVEERIKPEIPEQRMKRELAKIPPSEKTAYKLELGTMGLEVNPGNILTLHKLCESTGRFSDPYYILTVSLESLGRNGLIKSQEDLRNYGTELLGIGAEYGGADSHSYYQFTEPFESIANAGLIKSAEDLKKFGSELRRLISNAGFYPYDLFKGVLPSLVDAGLVKSPEELRKFGDELIKMRESYPIPDFDTDKLSKGMLVLLVQTGLVKSPEDLREGGDALLKTWELFRNPITPADLHDRDIFVKAFKRIGESGLMNSIDDLKLVFADLSKNPHLISPVLLFSQDELSRLKPQDFSAQLIELGAKKIAELVDFPFEKITSEQKGQLAKMLSGVEFIQKNEEVRTLIRQGLGNTFQQYYEGLEENGKLLKWLKELGVDTDAFVLHNGIDKAVFQKTVTGVERLETGEEHIKSVFYDAVMQLFNNPRGEVFNKPAKIFAELTNLDAREYKTPEERAKTIIEIMQSSEKKWLIGALSVLEKHLKTAGKQYSSVVDSEMMRREAGTALFHIQELERTLGMPVKPLAGEAATLTISVKLSDKNPLTALTTGSDSGCCVAFNGTNNWTLPIYMKDMDTQIAEIFVTKEGKEQRIGQAWLFGGRVGEEAVVLIDSINVTSAYKDVNEVYKAAIDFIKDFAEKAGFKKVVMGTNYNDAYPYAEKNFEKQEFRIQKLHTFDRTHSDKMFYSDTLFYSDFLNILPKTAANSTVFVIE
jgi:hypothetical protein